MFIKKYIFLILFCSSSLYSQELDLNATTEIMGSNLASQILMQFNSLNYIYTQSLNNSSDKKNIISLIQTYKINTSIVKQNLDKIKQLEYLFVKDKKFIVRLRNLIQYMDDEINLIEKYISAKDKPNIKQINELHNKINKELNSLITNIDAKK